MNKRLFFILSILVCVINYGHAQLLYQITGSGLTKPSYIFGTHHFAPLSIIDSIPAASDVINEVETICGEIDMVSSSQMAMAMQMQPYMMAPSDSTLSTLFTTQELETAKRLFNEQTGLQLEMFETMRPIVPQLTVVALGAKKYFGQQLNDEQLDTWFQKTGKEKGKQISGLESLAHQAQLLYTVTPLPIQARNLLKLLENPEDGYDSISELTEAYMTQNLEKMAQVSHQQEVNAEDEAFIRALLHNRNAEWLTIMPEKMASSPTLFVVGALHLPEPTGIIEGLRKKGFSVQPIEK